mmetsp:Transcript_52455/g.161492  ORF Transcript_52455/g.161492 Transcript_52455/m.161492 type:complete len:327 (-) Transcript_52455:253-1233(-)
MNRLVSLLTNCSFDPSVIALGGDGSFRLSMNSAACGADDTVAPNKPTSSLHSGWSRRSVSMRRVSVARMRELFMTTSASSTTMSIGVPGFGATSATSSVFAFSSAAAAAARSASERCARRLARFSRAMRSISSSSSSSPSLSPPSLPPAASSSPPSPSAAIAATSARDMPWRYACGTLSSSPSSSSLPATLGVELMGTGTYGRPLRAQHTRSTSDGVPTSTVPVILLARRRWPTMVSTFCSARSHSTKRSTCVTRHATDRATMNVCCASTRDGLKMAPTTRRERSGSRVSRKWAAARRTIRSMTGTTKASVLPDPVAASTITELPG